MDIIKHIHYGGHTQSVCSMTLEENAYETFGDPTLEIFLGSSGLAPSTFSSLEHSLKN